MDIKPPSGTNLRTEPPVSSKARASASTQEIGKGEPRLAAEDSVTLTTAAKTLKTARGEAQGTPIDEQRVAALRAAIAEGRYEIDNQRLAQHILQFEGSLV